jgi:hypothetical protein
LREGTEVEFHLVRRQTNSSIVWDEASIEACLPKNSAYVYHPGVVPFTRIVYCDSISPIVERERAELKKALWLANSTQDIYLIPFIEKGMEDLNKREEEAKKSKAMSPREKSMIEKRSPRGEFGFYYQISNADNIYLHPLDFNCIIDEYGEYSNLPTKLRAPLLEIDSENVDIPMTKKNPYFTDSF